MYDWVGEGWGKDTYLFIGAAGIAVRSIAPRVKDKFTDSPVLVMDEKGGYIIPLLSSHLGGAGETARIISALTGAVPVVTTATDLNRKFAVDLFCEGKRNADFGQGSCKRDFGPDSAGKSSWVLFGLPGEGERVGGASDKAGVQEAKRNAAGHCRA